MKYAKVLFTQKEPCINAKELFITANKFWSWEEKERGKGMQVYVV